MFDRFAAVGLGKVLLEFRESLLTAQSICIMNGQRKIDSKFKRPCDRASRRR